ncbi:MAG: DUF3500 domain-containing protein [Kofleriaceae bacterium]
MKLFPVLCVVACTPAASVAQVAEPVPDDPVLAAEMTEAARRFLSALPEPQARRARFGLDDAERMNWHYIPRARRGVALGELGDPQRHLAYGFLATALGRRGLLKASAIMALEEVLRQRGGAFTRDPGAYFLAVFGEPSTRSTWGWRLEGHHLSLNLTLIDGRFAVAAPAFLGAAPSLVGGNGMLAGTRVLGLEEDLGFELINSLEGGARREAIHDATAPEDVLAGPGDVLAELPGLPEARMTPAQRRILGALLDEILENLPREVADRERTRLAPITFTWMGSTAPGKPHYFRLAGPRFVYEYDNTQEQATHVHTVWHVRESAGGDFGADLLRAHYRQDHQ